MALFMKDSLCKIVYLVMEFRKENFISTMVNGSMEKCMETELVHGQMQKDK